MPRTLVNGHHGSLESSKNPRDQCHTQLEDGRVFHQHVDHLRARVAIEQPSVEMDDYPTIELPSKDPDLLPADPSPTTVGQSLRRSSQTHKSLDRYGVTVRH